MILVFLRGQPKVFELGQIFLNGIVQHQLAIIDEHHYCRCGHGLGLGCDPEQGVGSHGSVLGDVGEAEGVDMEQPLGVGDGDNGAGK